MRNEVVDSDPAWDVHLCNALENVEVRTVNEVARLLFRVQDVDVLVEVDDLTCRATEKRGKHEFASGFQRHG